MKKISKFFLLAVIYFGFMGLTYAQDLGNPAYEYLVLGKQKLGCENMIQNIDSMFLARVLIILLTLSICGILFHNRLNDDNCDSKLLSIPVLNIYSLFKITIGKWFFYILAFNLLFLVYVYMGNWYFYGSSSFKEYIPMAGLIIGPFSLFILCGLFYQLARKLGWDNFISVIFAIFLPAGIIRLFSLFIGM